MIKELHNKIDNLQTSLEKAEAKAKIQEEKINILLRSSNKERTSIPIQRPLNTQLKPPEKPLGGSMDINMIHIKNFKAQLKQKCSKKKPKMNWNKFGDNEWQVVETALKQQKLPSVRNEYLFLFGSRPKGKTYEITKFGNLVTVNQIHQKFDVFDSNWINMVIEKAYEFISHGLFQCRMQGLHCHT